MARQASLGRAFRSRQLPYPETRLANQQTRLPNPPDQQTRLPNPPDQQTRLPNLPDQQTRLPNLPKRTQGKRRMARQASLGRELRSQIHGYLTQKHGYLTQRHKNRPGGEWCSRRIWAGHSVRGGQASDGNPTPHTLHLSP